MFLRMSNTRIFTGDSLRFRFATHSPFLSYPTRTNACVSSKDYLVSSLSLSPESINDLKIFKCKPIALTSTSNADSIVALFKSYGFSSTHIAKIFYLCPRLLNYDPNKVLNPKLLFLSRSCTSTHTLVHVLTTSPRILERSLRNQIAPCFDFLSTFFSNNPQALNSLLLHKRASFVICSFSEYTPVNVETLRRHGVPDSSILRLFLLGGGPACLGHGPEHFSKNLEDIEDMGFDLLSASFPHGFVVYCSMNNEKWVSKMELLKDCFGWTRDEQVLALFVKQPAFMKLSVENLRKSLDFFMKRLGWTPDYIAKYPTLLGCSLEKRILPRISVLEILQLKGLVEKAAIGLALTISEDRFMRRFVNKYQKDLLEVQLLEVYTNSMQNSQFGGSD